ncbi:axin-1-like isoform X1 [Crassostrea virginica]|uniref:Axin-1-like isoform X1 n=1 Tax=Crassostrea virginica TaxID=6565 RepID=A0A8B8CGA6_CRAVI|nr:axin-1-like isoform X1 [Crassostrea virginica]XP_022314837.1 axin-1-like isoform X1 [Crassostrea virginica]XP_022314838.1 axin-1-like isoform X1 [Crassostrea virginica]
MTSNKVCQFLSESGGNNFTESAPRPPVPGEENEIVSNGGMSTRSSESMKSHVSNKSGKSQTSTKSTTSNRDLTTHSPAATPRRSAKDKTLLLSGCDSEEAPLGFEPEGSDSNSPPFHENMENSSPPPFMRWAENLTYLLDDRDGLSLFTTFLDQEGFGKTYVEFYFACEGLKKSEPKKVPQIVKIINRKYFKSDKLPCVSEQTKCVIQEKIRKQTVDRTIFDGAQLEVRNEMSSHSYPLFIKSDLYVQYIQKGADSPRSNSSSGSNSARPMSMPLPTLPEDKVLSDVSNDNSASLCGPPSSCKRPPSAKRTLEIFTSTSFPAPPRVPPHPYHVSYAPTSEQESEIQSLSSDALTEDTLSITDTSSIDNDSKRCKRQRRYMRREHMTRNPIESGIIPRTERLPKDRNLAETNPQQFAALIIEKLEKLLQDHERNRIIEESLNRVIYDEKDGEEADQSLLSKSIAQKDLSSTSLLPLMTSAVIDEDNPDSILEEHCSRIWESSVGQTPSRSPGRHSPPTVDHRSHDRSRSKNQSQPSLPSHKQTHRKRPDYYSSFDSGMGEERLETHRHIHHHHHHHHPSSKSRAFPEYDSQKLYTAPDFDRSRPARKSGKCKHSDTSSNIDSGISMIESIPPMPNPNDPSTEKVLNWMMDNARENSNSGCADSDKSSSHKQRSRPNASASSSTPAYKSGSKKQGLGTSRSGSVDRGGGMQPYLGSGGFMPSQPFATDPSMPLPTPPNTTVQLEEAKRRLEERSVPTPVKSSRSFGGITNKESKKVASVSQGATRGPAIPSTKTVPCDLDMSGDSSTLEKKSSTKKSGSSSANTSGSADETVIGYYLCSEPIPYRITVPGKHITLFMFKQLIGRKGNFKYFFKKRSNEFESEVVFEEISNDDEELPLWDGKIVAKVDKMD